MLRNISFKKIAVVFFAAVVWPVFAAATQDAAFNQLADEYLDTIYLPNNPSQATALGVHDYDSQIENYSNAGVETRIKQLETFKKRVESIDPSTLDERTCGDRDLVLNNINSQLLTLQKIRPWEKNPDYYSGGITNDAFVVMEREFAPADDRLRSLIAREKLMPEALADARFNLKNPPKIYTEIAIEQLPGIINFFKQDVPKAFSSVTDAALQKEFKQTNIAVIRALEAYQHWLTIYLLPRSHGDFRIGADNFRQKLKYDEMIDIPLPRLLAIGWADLKKNQRAYKRLVWELTKNNRKLAAHPEKLADHPAPDQLLQTFSSSFDSIVEFINANRIITIPSDVRPVMEETPPFLRATTFASMDTPGPFEKNAQTAYFNVTLPSPVWNADKVNDYMRMFNYPAIKDTVIHETYPGHYVQFLWMHQVPGRIRKILGANTNAEGWAHYCEQMMLDAGFGQAGNAGEAKLMRLGQLQNALLRNARFIVGIRMHTGKMSLEQAANFFVKQGYQSKSTGWIETKRGTSDPTYLYYTLGKLQIMKLRKDMEAKQGKAFNLQQFHDTFMQQGFPPIKIVRRAMLQNDSATL